MEHTQQQAQEGIIAPIPNNLVLQVSAEVEGHTKSQIEVHVVIPTIQEEHTKPQMINAMI